MRKEAARVRKRTHFLIMCIFQGPYKAGTYFLEEVTLELKLTVRLEN